MKRNHDSPSGNFGKSQVIITLVSGLVFLFIAMFTIREGNGFIFILPPALILLFFLFLSIDRFLILTVFLVPLSVQLRFLVPDPPADIFLPTELMLAAILILMVFKTFITRETDRRLIRHPVSVVIWIMLGWTFVTALSGTIALVSLKSLVTKLWFISGFYLLAAEVFKEQSRVRSYFLAFFAGMTPVVIIFIVRMWQNGLFNQGAAYAAPRPFFVDHTSLGAALAFCIPVIIYYILQKNTPVLLKNVLLFQLILFIGGFILSYSRAAWISLAVAGFASLILLLKVSWKIVLPVFTVIVIVIASSWTDIIIRLNENRQDSSADIARHLQSISNIRTDASNMERINRWKSALRMSAERPLLGWGPGTYQFRYAPFQISTDKTIISTNYGEGGNAHSEYLSALAESGVPGLIIFLSLVIIFLMRGIYIWKHHSDRNTRLLALAMVTGLVTYVIHGGLNNFLDSDKISALFWGMIAVIVAIDIKMREKQEEKSDPQVGSDN